MTGKARRKRTPPVGVRLVRGREARELLALPHRVDASTSKLNLREVRALEDGRALAFVSGATWALHDSFGAFAERCREGEARMRRGPVNLAGELLPPIDDFLHDAEARAARLGPVIGVRSERLDYSVESLKAVDAALGRIGRAEATPPDLVPAIVEFFGAAIGKRTTPAIIAPLVAYVGEVMRRATAGRWENPAALPTSANPREPMIVTGKGHLLQPFAAVVVSINPDSRTRIHTYVDTALRSTGAHAAKASTG